MSTDYFTAQEGLLDPLDRPVWGAEAIGAVVGKTEAEAFHLLGTKVLDADKAGGRWVSTPRRVLKSIGCEPGSGTTTD
jgi:hypothetical protein